MYQPSLFRKPQPKGEAHSQAKLSRAEVAEILASKKPQAVLAGLYGVSQTQVWRIKKGLSWANLD